MIPCLCGHWHAVTCYVCGCTTYETEADTEPVDYWPTGAYTQDVYRYEAVMARRGDLSL